LLTPIVDFVGVIDVHALGVTRNANLGFIIHPLRPLDGM
jgi:hypothetical protein